MRAVEEVRRGRPMRKSWELGEGGSPFEPVDAAPPLVASDRGQVPRELVLQVARVLADFRDYADTYFRRLMDILGQDQE